jgi:hypothetical protein
MNRQIVAYESDPAEPEVGRLIAIDPQDATGIPIPAFRYGPTRPAVGQIKGEAFISTVTGVASVWDGNKWQHLALPVVVKFPDDAALLAATLPDDTVAVSQASGNLFTRVSGKWLPLGIRVYPTQVDLDADSPPDGSLALAADTGEFAVRSAGVWVALANQAINVGPTAPPNPVGGNIWIDTSGGQSSLLFYDGTKWIATPRAQRDELWVTAPAGRGIAEGVYTFAEIDAAAWASLEPGRYWVIKELDANGKIPQMQRISQSVGSPVSIGDWVVALDTDHNGVTDHLQLINHREQRPAVYTHQLSANNVNNVFADFAAPAENFVRIKGHYVNGNSSNSLGVIMKIDGNWVDWGSIVDAVKILQTDHDNGNVPWIWVDRNSAHPGPWGMMLLNGSASEGIRRNSFGYYDIELTLSDAGWSMKVNILWEVDSNGHYIQNDGYVAFKTSTSGKVTGIGLKTFKAGSSGSGGNNMNFMGQVESN